jgi:hypothetical protein
LYLFLRRNDDHDDQRQDGKEQAENSPPSGLRPFIAAMTPHTTAAMMLPIATNMPLTPLRMNPAASGVSPKIRPAGHQAGGGLYPPADWN